MPMSFPDLESFIFAAEVWKHVERKDFIEAHEIRTGKGHDEWGDAEKAELRRRVETRDLTGRSTAVAESRAQG
jgi:hypothetical protein